MGIRDWFHTFTTPRQRGWTGTDRPDPVDDLEPATRALYRTLDEQELREATQDDAPCTSCPEHVEDMRELVIPLAPGAPEAGMTGFSVGDLLDDVVITADEVHEPAVLEPAAGERVHEVWVGDEARLLYSDDADLPLDASLAAQPEISEVAWLDRETFEVRSKLCPRGVLAALARALADPAVRQA